MSVPTVLEKIIARKLEEVAERSRRIGLAELEQQAAIADPVRRALIERLARGSARVVDLAADTVAAQAPGLVARMTPAQVARAPAVRVVRRTRVFIGCSSVGKAA